MTTKAKKAGAGKAKPFVAWCVYRADGKPALLTTSRKVSVANISTSDEDNAEAVSEGNRRIPDGAPHHAVRVRITPIRPARPARAPRTGRKGASPTRTGRERGG